MGTELVHVADKAMIGIWTDHILTDGVSGSSMSVFTRAPGWSTAELEALLADVQKDLKGNRYPCLLAM